MTLDQMPVKGRPMTPLAAAILEAATTSLAHRRGTPITECTLSDCREDARAVAVAVLVTIGGTKGKPGLHPFSTRLSQDILSLADDLDSDGE